MYDKYIGVGSRIPYWGYVLLILLSVISILIEDICRLYTYSKTCVKRPLKIDKTKILMTNGSLIKVENISE